jgi:hypothetical protein
MREDHVFDFFPLSSLAVNCIAQTIRCSQPLDAARFLEDTLKGRTFYSCLKPKFTVTTEKYASVL